MGYLGALLAALGWGTDPILARQGLRTVPAALATSLSLATSLLICLAVGLVVGFAHFPLAGVAWFALIGLVNFFLGRQLNYRATRQLGAARVSALLATSPLVSITLAILFANEQVTPLLLVGVCLSITGVILVVGA
jgi:drug/metabolite transporter (DMT)-like permease